MALAANPLTATWITNGDIDWAGKEANLAVDFPNNAVSHEYGKTVGWTLKSGRDFSKDFGSDSTAFIINEAAAAFFGYKEPIGKIIRWNGKPYEIIGVVKNLVAESPYAPVRPSLFHLAEGGESLAILRLNHQKGSAKSLADIERILKSYEPDMPFEYKFVDEEFAKKFGDEERIGTLATVFAVLAVFISCLGLFGLASFIAEQRTKEIGVRKVLGASVTDLWALLTKDFAVLVLISCLLSTPIAYYFMANWISKYDYRTTLSWWIFAGTGLGALFITLLTVSYQSIRSALLDPVKSLRSE